MEEIAKLLAQAKENMSSAVAFFEKELQKVRAGKSSPQMLEGLKVDYYGNPTPIEQVGNISTPDARQIIVQPWERNMLQPIEKAILAANLGFTPQNTGEFIRIVVPTPTEERRKELVKKAKQDAEQLKVTIRNARRTANDAAMTKIDYVLTLNGKQVANTTLNQGINIPANSKGSVSIPITTDLFQLFSGESADAIVNLAFKLAGASSEPVNVGLKVKPYININSRQLAYPDFITLNKTLK